MLLFFTTGFQQSQLREQPLIQLCNHKCFPSISNIFRTWHFIMGSKKLPLLKTHIFLKTILKIVVAVVVDSFDEFCRFSVLQTLCGFLIDLKKKRNGWLIKLKFFYQFFWPKLKWILLICLFSSSPPTPHHRSRPHHLEENLIKINMIVNIIIRIIIINSQDSQHHQDRHRDSDRQAACHCPDCHHPPS